MCVCELKDYFCGIVNEVIKTISSLFFYEKILNVQKRKLLNYAVSALLLSNYFYPISTHKILWPNREVPGDQWRGVASRKSHRCCTVRSR